MNPIISAQDIVKTYGAGNERRRVLDGVSLEIAQGEYVAVMGPSGSGKSTLIYALSGMDGIEGGRVSFEGRELAGLKENELADLRRTRMGFVFQQPTLLRILTLEDNIALPSLRDKPGKAGALAEKARTLMARVGIGELGKRDVTQVSGGQLQRAGICRALMNDPRILFCDEPTGALNSKSSDQIMDLLAEINLDGRIEEVTRRMREWGI